MHGFNWLDKRGIEGIGFVRAIRTLLTHNTPHVLPKIKESIAWNFTSCHTKHPVVGGKCLIISASSSNVMTLGLRHSPVYPMIVRLTVITNALAFFGKDLGESKCPYLVLGQRNSYSFIWANLR